MDRIDTAPGETGHPLGASAYADRHDMQSFSVRFSIKPRETGIFSANRYALRIKGELTFSGAHAHDAAPVFRDSLKVSETFLLSSGRRPGRQTCN